MTDINPFFAVAALEKGYVVRVWNEDAGVTDQVFVKGRTEASLRRALEERNALYAALPFRAKGIALRPVEIDDRHSRTGTGYAYISEVARGRAMAFYVRHRRLEDAAPRSRRFPYGTSKTRITRSEALRAALAWRDAYLERVQRVIEAYNARTREVFLELAEQEARDLTPRLYALQGFDADRWDRSRAMVEGARPAPGAPREWRVAS